MRKYSSYILVLLTVLGIHPVEAQVAVDSVAVAPPARYQYNYNYGYTYRQQQPKEDPEEIRDKIYLLGKTKGKRSDDSLRIELVNQLSVYHRSKKKDSSLFYARAALKESQELKFPTLTAVSYYNIAKTYDYHKQDSLAEENYLLWMQVRKDRNDDEYRWALHEMRGFYIKTRQEDKLAKIEEEWMVVLDRQLSKGEITPWYTGEDDDPTPEGSYKASTVCNFYDLTSNGYYFIAEKSFLHMMEKCSTCTEWDYSDNPYSSAQFHMLRERDTTNLTIWYDHWHNALNKYAYKEDALDIYSSIASNFYNAYNFSRSDVYFDKYFPLMMTYSRELGGEEAVYELIDDSRSETIATYLIKIKLNLYQIESGIKLNKKEMVEKLYKETDQYIELYLQRGKSPEKLKELFTKTANTTSDAKFKKWCQKKAAKL